MAVDFSFLDWNGRAEPLALGGDSPPSITSSERENNFEYWNLYLLLFWGTSIQEVLGGLVKCTKNCL